MRQHLRVHHVSEYTALEKQQNTEISEKKARLSTNDEAGEGSKQLKQTQLQQSSLQSSYAKFDKSHPKQQIITEKIALMICKDMQPYSIVDDVGFRSVIQAAEPRYVMPSRKTFAEEIIPQLFAKTTEAVKSDVHNAVGVAFTTDAWTSRANQGYLSYTAHFLTANFEQRNYCLAVENIDESHTAATLAKSLSEQTVAWTTETQRANKLKIAVVSDNAANIQSALSKVPFCTSVNCFDHTLQLAINDAVHHCDELQTTVQKAKSITTHFRHSSKNTKILLDREKQLGMQQMKLKQECATRWNSRYDMLQRLVTVKDAVSSVVASVKSVSGLSANEWEIAEEYVKVFKPFKVLTAVMSSASYPTISMVIPELNKLKHTLQTNESFEATCLPTLKEDLVASIDRRWPRYETNSMYAIATMIDPRYKDCGFTDNSAAAYGRSLVLQEMENVTAMNTQSTPTADSGASSQPTPGTSGSSGMSFCCIQITLTCCEW